MPPRRASLVKKSPNIFPPLFKSFFLQLQAELREYKPKMSAPDGGGKLETSALGLTFKVTPEQVSSGLKLECTASIGSVYWQSFQEKIPVAARETPAAMAGNWWKGSSASKGSKCYEGK
jgi:hypothetical protein